jgi:hypothetical protein
LGQPEAAVASYREALRINPDYGIAQSNLLFGLNYRVDQGIAAMLGRLVAKASSRRGMRAPSRPGPIRETPNDACAWAWSPGICANHAVGHFLEGVLAALATTAAGQLEIFGYPTHFVADAVTDRIRASCRGGNSAVRLSDEAFAKRIREVRSTSSSTSRAITEPHRLSDVRVETGAGAGHLARLSGDDRRGGDRLSHRRSLDATGSEEDSFTEKIWRLPESYLCFTPPIAQASVTPLPALTNDRFTFGSFNNLSKINDAVVAVWSRLLDAVPDSQLFIKAKQFEGEPVRKRMSSALRCMASMPAVCFWTSHVPEGQHLLPLSARGHFPRSFSLSRDHHDRRELVDGGVRSSHSRGRPSCPVKASAC